MNPSRIILGTIIILIELSSCVEFFNLHIDESDAFKYVVDGRIVEQSEFQVVKVSTTSTLSKPTYSPLSFCKVSIIDNYGNVFNLKEYEKGLYKVKIEEKYLKPGNSYKVIVITNSGFEFESEFDKMPECPEVDSVYWIREDRETSNPLIVKKGIHFFIDLKGKDTDSHFYQWILTETYEHHAPVPDNPESSVCWTTSQLKNIYVLSTLGLTHNSYTKYPFHFVDNTTQRLNFGYSLLIEQYAISESAYIFLSKLKFNSDLGGLYSTQPMHVIGNIKCKSNPEQEVLGFFCASSLKSKRIFVQNVPNLPLLDPICVPDYDPEGRPIIGAACTECNYWDGTTKKPEFWPNK